MKVSSYNQACFRFNNQVKEMIETYAELERLQKSTNLILNHMIKWSYQTRMLLVSDLPITKKYLTPQVNKVPMEDSKITTMIDHMSDRQAEKVQHLLRESVGEIELSRQQRLWQLYKEKKLISNNNIPGNYLSEYLNVTK